MVVDIITVNLPDSREDEIKASDGFLHTSGRPATSDVAACVADVVKDYADWTSMVVVLLPK